MNRPNVEISSQRVQKSSQCELGYLSVCAVFVIRLVFFISRSLRLVHLNTLCVVDCGCDSYKIERQEEVVLRISTTWIRIIQNRS